MPNPVLVEVTRGALVESIHRGSVAIVDAGGAIRFALGDLETPVYPRSSLKPIQALPLLESGAADAFGLGDEEIALACASHSGEPMHTARVAAWLKRLSPKQTFLVSEGEYGLAIEKELSEVAPMLKIIRIQLKGSKPDRTVGTIIQRLR